MDKSADAFRTISEVADHLDTPAHVLRFWESRFPQIRPVKRAGGRRYYRPSDVALLTGIKRLLHDEGMTIRGVQKILREQGVRYVSGVTGDTTEDDPVDDAAYTDLIDDAVVTMPSDPTPFRPAPGLTEAMAKAVDHQPNRSWSGAPSSALPVNQTATVEAADGEPEHSEPDLSDINPFEYDTVEPVRVEPVQGALLLMPASEREADTIDSHMAAVRDDAATGDAGIAANVRASQLGDDDSINASKFDAAPFPETPIDIADFDDEDFDDGPTQTLASRIRALPQGASAAKVGAELLAVMARLQALRDAVAEAAQTGRA